MRETDVLALANIREGKEERAELFCVTRVNASL